jgi:hypothetical protein
MNNFNCEKYFETLLNNFTENYLYYSNLKIKKKNQINIPIKNKKTISWDEEKINTFYYYDNKKTISWDEEKLITIYYYDNAE